MTLLKRACREVLWGQRTAPWFSGVRPADLKYADAVRAMVGIRRKLRDGAYEFRPARKGFLPRPGKEPRIHAIPALYDAIVLRALLLELRPTYDRLHDYIVGGRPGAGASVHRTVWLVYRALSRGPCCVLRFDLKNAFARASWSEALHILETQTRRSDVVAVLRSFYLAQERRFQGLVEGSPTAPFMLALVLSDRVMPYAVGLSDHAVVYLDDGILVARLAPLIREARVQLDEHLAPDMVLHPLKTNTYAYKPGTYSEFSFLNFIFGPSGPLPGPEATASLFDILGLIRCEASDIDERSELMVEAIDGFRRYYCMVADPALDDIDNRIAADFGGITNKFPKVSEGPSLRMGPSSRKRRSSTGTGESGFGDEWVPKSVARFLRGHRQGSRTLPYSYVDLHRHRRRK